MKKRKRGLRIKNKSIQIIIALAILIIGIVAVYAYAQVNKDQAWHSPDEVIVSIDNCNVTLQDAIANGYLNGTATPTICLLQSEFLDAYHLASEIIVTINPYTLTLQDSIDQNYFKGTGTINSSSTSLPSKGHLAEDIDVLVGSISMSLQEAITEEKLVPACEPDCIGKECGDDGCGGICPPDCGSYASCPSGTCVCDTGWDDCDNDNSCECDLSLYQCNAAGVCDYTYFWYTGACSEPCAGGTRTVQCQRSDGIIMADSICITEVGPKPSTSCNTQTCTGTGCTGVCPWGKCGNYYCCLNGRQARYYKSATGQWSSWSYSYNAAQCWIKILCNGNCQWQIKA